LAEEGNGNALYAAAGEQQAVHQRLGYAAKTVALNFSMI
jgi:hypothetical protein